MEAGASSEDYLKAIFILQKMMGTVRSADVARYLNVSKPSVFYAVSTLRNNGFLHVDDQHFLLLTKAGRTIAENTFEKHKFFSAILIEAGVEPKTAEKEACRIEHTISTESFQRLKQFIVDHINNDRF